MTDREVFERFGYDPDDPVPRDAEGERIIPDALLDDLASDSECSPMELLALERISHGCSTNSAAAALGKTGESIKTQLKQARLKLRAETTAHACCEAIRRGLIP